MIVGHAQTNTLRLEAGQPGGLDTDIASQRIVYVLEGGIGSRKIPISADDVTRVLLARVSHGKRLELGNDRRDFGHFRAASAYRAKHSVVVDNPGGIIRRLD